MRFLLDTNVVIALLNQHPRVTETILGTDPRDICLSVVVAHELFYGAYRAARTERAIEQFESLRFEIVDLTREDARRAGAVRAALAAAGTPIGPYDVLIAGQALQRGLVVVTRNTREFSRVPGLDVENWEDEAG